MLQNTLLLAQPFKPFDSSRLRRKSTEKILKQKIKQQEAAVKIGGLALSGSSIQEIMDEAVKLITSILGTQITTIVEFDKKNYRFNIRAQMGIDKKIISGRYLAINRGSQTLYTISRKKPIISADSSKEKRFNIHPWLLEHKVKSSMCVVIEGPCGEAPFGVLSTYSIRKRDFARHDSNFLQSVANILAMAVARKKTEEENLRIRDRLYLSQEVAKVGTFEWNLKTNNVVWTQEMEALYGLLPGNFEGSIDCWAKSIYPDDLQEFETQILRSVREKRELDVEFRVIWPTGQVRWLHAKGRTYFDKNNGLPLKMVGVNIDVTERKELERRKDEFISTASHELKTPIATLKSFTEILLNFYSVDPKSKEYLGKMDYQIDRLTRLVNDLLDVSKIQAGKLILQKEIVDLNELVKTTVEDIRPVAQNHMIMCCGQVNSKVRADKYRLSQVLVNLMSNAIKYSPKSDKVIVNLSSDNKNVYVSVQDFGIGVSRKDAPRIFEPFYQVSTRIRQSYSGLGLGLHISSEIVQRHGGKIWVESERGKGSTFVFALPLQRER